MNNNAKINDLLRTTFLWKVVITRWVDHLEDTKKEALLSAVRWFEQFTEDNDPYGEHDFWAIEMNGERFFWKIDNYGWENANLSERVLTIMRADEY